ncbi:glycosyltransferase family 39 protein [Paenibacillus sp. YN15]|uniref:glycosyltransferase family 39 protein n=1 Tax=Paenibacillus sp. YN15 TaxID=1742774 RepID=UPI000DCE8B3F|nr:glycosyltransferase family 39 protein [Paenibacillus sp. YN15]RAU91083.1 hypothetical protein DQG13_29955 [Paenibacillus sp. YN15]
MKQVTLSILAAMLLIFGTVLRLELTDWNRSRQMAATGVRLTPAEVFVDREIRSRFPLETNIGLPDGHTAARLSAAAYAPLPAGYARFLTLCYRLFGSAAEPPMLAVQILQNGMNALSLLLLMAVIRLLVNQPWLALAAGSLYYLHPAIIQSSSGFNSESLYTCMTILLVYCAVSFFANEQATPRRSIAYGCGLGVGMALHPFLVAYGFLFASVAGMQCYLTSRRFLQYALMVAVCTAVLCAAWL